MPDYELSPDAERDLFEIAAYHFVFALRRKRKPLLVLAVLHESMDLLRRLRSRLPT